MLNKLLFIIIFSYSLSYAKTVVNIDSSQKFQTIDGWEAVSNAMEARTVRDTLMPYLDTLINIAVNEVGITRLRFSLKSGMEDSVDYFQKMIDNEITYEDFKMTRYSKINDNDDPFDVNTEGFKFSGLDHNIENLIIPFKNDVESNGDRFYYNICFVDFADQSEFHHTDNPEEYAEFIEYTWSHINKKYGFIPDGLEVILEPDNADVWNANHLPDVIVATGRRFESKGYNSEIVAPSVMNLRNVPAFFEKIKNNPIALKYLDVLSYHRYSGGNDTIAQQEIVDISKKYNLKTAMLEYDKSSDINELHYDLKYNNVVAWTKYALMYKSDEKFAYVYVNARDENNPKFGICKQTKYLRHYFKFIRPDAVRIKAEPYTAPSNPIAFINPNGTQVVVIKTETSDSIKIEGLKTGSYGITYTLGNYNWGSVGPKEYNVDLPEQTISYGESIEFYMPDQGVVTIYGLKDPTTSIISRSIVNKIKAYPNPANNWINARYTNEVGGNVRISLVNMSGNEVAELANGYVAAGEQVENFILNDINVGMYILKIETPKGVYAKKLLISK